MEEKLQYFTDICNLADYRLMKTLVDDTKDDPKPVVKKEKKDSRDKKRPKAVEKEDEIDPEAGPSAPKQKGKVEIAKENYNKLRKEVNHRNKAENRESAPRRKEKGGSENRKNQKFDKPYNKNFEKPSNKKFNRMKKGEMKKSRKQ